ncbi:hypothetical protein [Brachyspira innocens]|uniref:hypothetical protein n=1 Tax=Brachyspira innocens TaxID=13264 RepID=UPI0026EEED30|nr:hypothetical protein [Brachyspira innocens]
MQSVNTYSSINKYLQRVVNEAINLLPKSLPCRVLEVNGNKVRVERLLKNNNIIGFVDNVPIVRAIYYSYPIKAGDLGVLIPSDYPVVNYVDNNLLQAKEMRTNSDGMGYMFFPLAPTQTDFLQNNEAFEIYSLDGLTSIIIDNDKIQIKDNASGDDEGDNNNILIDKNGINILDTNKNNIVMNSDGISVTDVNENNIIFNSDGINITDKNDNKITLSSSGVTVEDKNRNVIEMGTTSVKINNNLEVLQ